MNDIDPELISQAHDFADRLSQRIRRVLPDPQPQFLAQVLPGRSPSLVVWPVSTGDTELLPQPLTLVAQGRQIEQRLHLRVIYRCCADTSGQYLTIEESSLGLGLAAITDPLVRFEYQRATPARSRLPAAHIQVHAHRDETVWLMLHGDEARPAERWRRRRLPRMAEMHLPVGGDRYRPCLEDVLGLAITEFGASKRNGAWNALEEGRAEWRRFQLRAAVRDAPAVAAEELRKQGWTVTPHENANQSERTDRLGRP